MRILYESILGKDLIETKSVNRRHTPPEDQVGFDSHCLHRTSVDEKCKIPQITPTEKSWWERVRKGTSSWAKRAWPNNSEELCFNIHNFSSIYGYVYGKDFRFLGNNENLQWSLGLVEHERAVFSLAGSDGVLEETFRKFGTTNRRYVEIGTGKGAIQCNTRYFREVYGWSGVMFDKKAGSEKIGLFRAAAESRTICSLLSSKNVPISFDLFSIDIDGIDYHILKTVLECGYKPRVVVAEYNAQFGPLLAATAPNDKKLVYQDRAMGAATGVSLFALVKVMSKFGYSLYYCDRHGLDSYFIRLDLLKGQDLALQLWSNILYRFPAHKDKVEKFSASSIEKIEVLKN